MLEKSFLNNMARLLNKVIDVFKQLYCFLKDFIMI